MEFETARAVGDNCRSLGSSPYNGTFCAVYFARSHQHVCLNELFEGQLGINVLCACIFADSSYNAYYTLPRHMTAIHKSTPKEITRVLLLLGDLVNLDDCETCISSVIGEFGQ